MPNHGADEPAENDVTATLTYLKSAEVKPVYHASAGALGSNQIDAPLAEKSLIIHDGRRVSNGFALDRNGFELTAHSTQVKDFYDMREVRDVYEPEVQQLIGRLTGARHVHVFDHTIRTDSQNLREAQNVRDPVPLVHNDYTERSARQRVRDLLPAQAEDRLRKRFAILNVWRSIAGIVETTPMAMCDAQTIPAQSVVPLERRAKDRIGEMQQGIFDDAHRWYYFPKMKRDEALIFKTYDAARDGRARSCLHSAFVHPNPPADAAPRQSIETRVFAFFDRPLP